METLAAISLASNLLQFAELGVKLFLTAKQIYASGSTADNQALADDAKKLKDLAAETLYDRESDASKSGQQLHSICLECRHVADQLLGTFDQVRVKFEQGKPSKWKSFEAALAHILKGGNMRKLERELSNHKKNLQLFLTVTCLKEQSAILDIVQRLRDQNDRLETQTTGRLEKAAEDLTATCRQIQHLQRTQRKELMEPKEDDESSFLKHIREFQHDLETSQEERLCAQKQQYILQSLRFHQFKTRQDAIKDNHRKTFEWIFHSDTTRFPQWLKYREGIFWIAGKPGSGKSTLMKFLATHPTTKAALKSWGGSKDVVIASHYFWNAGNNMQKSRLGLLQTLLFEVLRNLPELIRTVCHSQWHYSDLGLPLEWTENDLMAVFKELSAYDEGQLEYKFCFFIDGLDEQMDERRRYEETFEELLDILSQLVSSPSIKICASSRPWPQFKKSFNSREWKLQVEKLTSDDIKTFVNDNLVYHGVFHNLPKEELLQIATIIFNKAQGVFLWVDLVMKALKRGQRNNDTANELRQRLNEIPEDLEDFFQHMLDNIEPRYWGDTSRILRVMIESGQALPLLAFQFLDKEATDPDYAFGVEPVLEFKHEDLLTRLDARGRDLLSISDKVDDSDVAGLFRFQVDFLHRTVREFFSTPRGKRAMGERIERGDSHEFCPLLSLCKIMLSLGKAIPYRDTQPDYNRVFLFADGMMYYARKIEEKHEKNSVENGQFAGNRNTLFRLLDELDRSNSRRIPTPNGVHWTNYKGNPKGDFQELRMKTFLATAVQSRLSRYVEHKLLEDPSQAKHKPGRPLLDYALRPTMVTPWELPGPEGPVLPVVKLLLGYGGDPNQRLEIYRRKSLWELFLQVCDGHDSKADRETLLVEEIAQVMIAMVSHGADLSCSIELREGGRGDAFTVAQRLGMWDHDIDRIRKAEKDKKQENFFTLSWVISLVKGGKS